MGNRLEAMGENQDKSRQWAMGDREKTSEGL